MGTEGAGEVVTDNAGAISQALNTHNATVAGPPVRTDDGICSVSGQTGKGAAGFLGALLLGLVAIRRRR